MLPRWPRRMLFTTISDVYHQSTKTTIFSIREASAKQYADRVVFYDVSGASYLQTLCYACTMLCSFCTSLRRCLLFFLIAPRRAATQNGALSRDVKKPPTRFRRACQRFRRVRRETRRDEYGKVCTAMLKKSILPRISACLYF